MMATEKQTRFITNLILQKQMPDDLKDRLIQRLADGDLDVPTASKTINWLMAQPDRVDPLRPKLVSSPDLASLEARVPEGRYALRLKEPDSAGNEVHFYIVDKPGENSKWHGRTFLSLMAGEDKFGVKNPVERQRILEEIDASAGAALLLYGQLIGRCGHCGRTLTNDESRARGIGPVCLSKDGMKWGLNG